MPPFAFGPAMNRGTVGGCCCGTVINPDPYYYPYGVDPDFVDGPCECCNNDPKILVIGNAVDSTCVPVIPLFDCDAPLAVSSYSIKYSELIGRSVFCYPTGQFSGACTGGPDWYYQQNIYSGISIATIGVEKCWSEDGVNPCTSGFTSARLVGTVNCYSAWNVVTGDKIRTLQFNIQVQDDPAGQGNLVSGFCGGSCDDAGLVLGAGPCGGQCGYTGTCTGGGITSLVGNWITAVTLIPT